jgi:hypothetical protein
MGRVRSWALELGNGPADIGRRAFSFTHGLVDHPLLSRDALADVAGRTPIDQLEHHLADLPLLLPTGAAAQLPMGAAEVLRTLDENGCWVALFNIEREDAYRALLAQALAHVVALPPREGAMGPGSASVFCAAAGAVVPVHFDRHHNLLLQVEGTKTVTIGAYDDPAIEQLLIERGFEKENADVVPTVSATFDLHPGDGVYIPPYAFHWVTNGDAPSVSLSCTFHTTRSDRMELLHASNVRLRRLGLRPSLPGASDRRDRAKAALLRGRRRIVRLRRR